MPIFTVIYGTRINIPYSILKERGNRQVQAGVIITRLGQTPAIIGEDAKIKA